MRKNHGNGGLGMYNTLQQQQPDLSSSNSIRQMLHDKIESDKKYGRQSTAQRQWILYKDQLNVNQYSSTGLGPNMTIPSALPPIMQLSTIAAAPGGPPQVDLRQQLQPFCEYSPQQIQEQLQHLHLKPHGEADGMTMDEPPLDDDLHGMHPLSLSNDTNSSSSVDTSRSRKSSTSSSLIAQLLSPPTPPMPVNLPSQTPSASTAEYINGLEVTPTSPRRYSVQAPMATPIYSPQVRQKRNTLPVLAPSHIPCGLNEDLFKCSLEGGDDIIPCPSPESSFNHTTTYRHVTNSPVHHSSDRTNSPSVLLSSSPNNGRPVSPTTGGQQRQRRSGMTFPSSEQYPQLQPNHQSFAPGQLVNGFIHENPSAQAHLQQIPIYLNQHISLIHPKVASQIAQQQVGRLVSLISTVLNNSGIVYEYNGNIFTVSHQGVEFQIHVQVSSHYTMQNALQLNLQYMHISGDPQLYQSLCTQLAPNFIPSLQ